MPSKCFCLLLVLPLAGRRNHSSIEWYSSGHQERSSSSSNDRSHLCRLSERYDEGNSTVDRSQPFRSGWYRQTVKWACEEIESEWPVFNLFYFWMKNIYIKEKNIYLYIYILNYSISCDCSSDRSKEKLILVFFYWLCVVLSFASRLNKSRLPWFVRVR